MKTRSGRSIQAADATNSTNKLLVLPNLLSGTNSALIETNCSYRFVMPYSIIIAALTIVLGPFLFPYAFTVILLLTFTFTLLLSTLHLIKFCISALKISRAIARGNDALVKIAKHTHVFIVPNFGESVDLLSLTLSKLAAHKHARTNYILVLAMEQSEIGYLDKSQILADTFKGQFDALLISAHPANVKGEARGKGSNVNHASRHAFAYLQKHNYNIDECIVTVMDSDSHIYPHYIYEIERALATIPDPLYRVFCPPIFFARNADRVPAMVRLTDLLWSSMIIQNLENSRSMVFPCSTYSLSMRLAESVGFWDVGHEAVGEDMHMAIKCFFKTEGRARAHPIYIPINLTNVQAKGYLAGIHARYTQAKRHYFGAWDVSYALTEYCKGDAKRSMDYLIDGALIIAHTLEAHITPSVTGLITAFGTTYFDLTTASTLSPSFLYLFTVTKTIALFSALPLLVLTCIYHALHLHVEKHLFKQESVRKWWHLTDFCFLFVSGFYLCVLPSCISGLRKLVDREEVYIVSKKDD